MTERVAALAIQEVAASTQQTAVIANQLSDSASSLDGAAESLRSLVVSSRSRVEHAAGDVRDVLAREPEVLVERACGRARAEAVHGDDGTLVADPPVPAQR